MKNSEDGSFGTVDVWDTKTDRPSDPVGSGGRRPRFHEDVILAMDEWMITIILEITHRTSSYVFLVFFWGGKCSKL